jgi:chromosomal replication initiator protein
MGRRPAAPRDMQRTIEYVADKYGLPKSRITERTNMPDASGSRHLVMWILKNGASWSFPRIGKAMGGWNHTTAIYACRKVDANRGKDAKVDAFLKQALTDLGFAHLPVNGAEHAD